MRRRSRSTGRCTASIDSYQGSCPVARYLFHDDGTGARSEDSAAARLARPRVPGGLAVSDFPAAPDLSQRDRGRVRPFHPGSEAGPRDYLRARSDRALRRTHRRPLEGESRGRGLGIPDSGARTRGRRGRAALSIRDRSVLRLDRLLRESLQRTLPLARSGCRNHRGNGPRLRGTRVSRRRTRTRSGPVRSHTSRRPGGSRALGGARLTLVGGLDAEFVEALAGEIRDRRPASKDEVERIKLRLARAHRLGGLPSDGAILQRMALADREGMKDLLRVKPARTASGVAGVTVMTAPHACPHGVCTYCPGGPRFGTPQSYLGTEPAAMRAAQYRYDPCAQTAARLRALRANGHETDKVDLIVIGGTFTALETAYQEWFVKGCLDGMNGFVADSLENAQSANESAGVRCIGLTIETKPDCFVGPEVEASMRLGTT